MEMPKWFIKQRRAWTVAKVIVFGQRIRDLRAARAGIDADVWPEDAAEFDKMIEFEERRQKRRLDYLATTPAL